jgi:hypothetical protein
MAPPMMGSHRLTRLMVLVLSWMETALLSSLWDHVPVRNLSEFGKKSVRGA